MTMSQASLAFTHYCERTGDGFWAEPLNALTNLAFILAAVAITRLLLRNSPTHPVWDLWLLGLLMVAVGIGSFLWHTLATPWSEWADVIPILLFINVFLLSFLVRVAGLNWPWVLFWFVVYQVFNFGLQGLFPRDFLNGSIFYLPTWVSLVVMAVYCRKTGSPSAGFMGMAALAFSVSLILRTVDGVLCPVWPVGTHFGWHVLNGVVLYWVARGVMGRAVPV